MAADLQVLEERLGHSFRDKDLLIRALTHKSLCAERKTGEDDPFIDNEQLEFLGDSVLGFLVSEHLVSRYPRFPEGRLSKLKAHLVSSAYLYEIAAAMHVGDFLHLGKGEEMSGGRAKKALIANALEALIAALFLDGGIDVVRRFVVGQILEPTMDHLATEESHVVDYKSALQERAQALRLPQPRYTIVQQAGPEHAKTFVVEVRVGGGWSSRGEGPSKKAAGQEAAKAVLEMLK
jgi:ribonuclease-3